MNEYYCVKWFYQQKEGNKKFEKKYAIYNCFTEQGLVLKNPNLVRKAKEIFFKFDNISSVELSAYTIVAAISLRKCYRLEMIIHTTDLRCIHLENYPFPKFAFILEMFRNQHIPIIDRLNLLPIIQKENYTEEFYTYMDKNLHEFIEKYHIDHPRITTSFSL